MAMGNLMDNAILERERERESKKPPSANFFRIRRKTNTGPIFWQENRKSGLCFYEGYPLSLIRKKIV